MLLITGCASTQTKIVKELEYVDRPVIVEKYIHPPEHLLVQLEQSRDGYIPIMPKDSKWGDLAKHAVLVMHKLNMCVTSANAIVTWVGKTKQIDAEP